jgi:CYTH domain-containing protein/predicted ATPase
MKKIVITGGPCAGKSTVIAMLQQEYGDKLVVVPEAATMLLGSGFPVPGKDLPNSPQWQLSFQSAVSALQIQLEASYALVAERQEAQLMVCDRGLLDGLAYMQEGFDRVLAAHDLDVERVYARYDQVIHLESVATCLPHLFDKAGNEQRYESLEEAQALELRTREAWKGHAAWSMVMGGDGIGQVAARVLAKVSPYLDREVERKFWLPALPEGLELGVGTAVEQGYLVTEGGELRIRRMCDQTFITVKDESLLAREEWERHLPRSVFDQLWSSTEGKRVEKTRYFLQDGPHRLELDLYEGRLSGLITVECEFKSEASALSYQLPDWGKDAVDVTMRKEFKNKNLAMKGIPAGF